MITLDQVLSPTNVLRAIKQVVSNKELLKNYLIISAGEFTAVHHGAQAAADQALNLLGCEGAA